VAEKEKPSSTEGLSDRFVAKLPVEIDLAISPF